VKSYINEHYCGGGEVRGLRQWEV